MCFVRCIRAAGGIPVAAKKAARRAVDQVFFVIRYIRQVAGQADLAAGGIDGHEIVQIHRLHDSFQRVVAIFSHARNIEQQIQFCGGFHCDQTRHLVLL